MRVGGMVDTERGEGLPTEVKDGLPGKGMIGIPAGYRRILL